MQPCLLAEEFLNSAGGQDEASGLTSTDCTMKSTISFLQVYFSLLWYQYAELIITRES